MNINTAIIRGSQVLKKNQIIKSPSLDSELLLSKVINKSREFMILNSNYNIDKKLSYILDLNCPDDCIKNICFFLKSVYKLRELEK